MVSFYALDLRYDSTREVIDTVARALKSLPEDKPEWFDGLSILEHAEELVGVAFVAAQVYLGGTVSDLSKVTRQKLRKQDLLGHGAALDVFPSVRKVEIIDAAANYWKHHDEWEDWKPNRWNQHTTETLAKVKVDGETEFPCHTIATLLGGSDYTDLDWLTELASAWRRELIEHFGISLP